MSTLTIRIEYTGATLVITNCPCKHDITITVSKFIDFDKTMYAGTLVVGDQPSVQISDAENVGSVQMYMNGKLTFAKYLKQYLGFIPYYRIDNNSVKHWIDESAFDMLSKSPVFTDIFNAQIPRAFMRYIRDCNMEEVKYDIRDILSIRDDTTVMDVIHEALTALNTPAQYTVNDMSVYYVLGMGELFDGEPRFINGDTLYLDTMDNRMQNGTLYPQLYKFEIPRVSSHLPLQLARYLPEYWKIRSIMEKFRNKSYLHSMALEAYMEDNLPM